MDRHKPVLLQAVCSFLEGKKTVVDCTLGLGGHTEAILSKGPQDMHVIGFDLDEKNLNDAKQRLHQFASRVTYVHSNFANLKQRLEGLGFGKVDGILLDLGLSSPHVDEAERGFSFKMNGPLDMRFDRSTGITAAEYLNKADVQDITDAIRYFGEDRLAYKIATAIVKTRPAKQFETTDDLLDVIKTVAFPKYLKDTTARVFQALRIRVNDELEVLKDVLPQAIEVLNPQGVLIVISYHSLEDRIVKHFFLDEVKECVCPLEIPMCVCDKQPSIKILTKKPVIADEQELEENPRSRSAKLRVVQKI